MPVVSFATFDRAPLIVPLSCSCLSCGCGCLCGVLFFLLLLFVLLLLRFVCPMRLKVRLFMRCPSLLFTFNFCRCRAVLESDPCSSNTGSTGLSPPSSSSPSTLASSISSWVLAAPHTAAGEPGASAMTPSELQQHKLADAEAATLEMLAGLREWGKG